MATDGGHDQITWDISCPPRDRQAIIDGCTCTGRREGKHDLCCEHGLRSAELLPSDSSEGN